MKYIRIKNNGEITPQALSLMGASTKRNDTAKIGQFGSGNKYAMAYFLRNRYDLQIYSGQEEIEITTVPETLGEQTFDVICIGGHKTSITTELGMDWEFWQSLREFYCNALDEGGCSLDFVQNPEPVEGETHIYLNNSKEAAEFISGFDNYFATNKKVLFECEAGRILEKSSTTANIYRKGIRCHNSDLQSVYDYDFSDIMIDENRLVKYSWHIEEKLWNLIYQCDVPEVVKKILHQCGEPGFIEGAIADFSTIDSTQISDVFKATLNSTRLAPKGYAGLLKPDEVHNHVILPTKVFNSVRSVVEDENVGDAFKVTRKGSLFRLIDETTPLQDATLSKALDFMKECSFPVLYDIRMAMFDEPKVLGTAYGETILLSDNCIQMGVNKVVETIIEEQVHIKHGVQDETRAFQDAIIIELVEYMKKMNAYEL